MNAIARLTTALVFTLAMTGCATGTKGVVPIGPDLYMVGGLGGYTDYSGSAVKARFFEQASKFCQERGQVMLPVNSTGHDAAYATYASAEVQFRCVSSSDPTHRSSS